MFYRFDALLALRFYPSSLFGFLKSAALLCAVLFSVLLTTSASHANPKYAGIVLDAKTGRTLYNYNADSKRYPASLTKMMTIYLAFEALERGLVKKSTRFKVSQNAAQEVPSKLGLRAGQTITVEQAIYALVTKSANDASTALAEFLGGSEAKFARMMTEKARTLRMRSTTFKNAHGLPNSKQVTTARDMARLGLALREHYPQYYKYFSTRSFKFGNTTYGNHNRLLGKVKGVDGIKTGYTRASGFNLVSSVEANGRSIVAVVMGGKTGSSRNAQMEKLIGTYLRKASRSGKGNFMAKSRISGLVPSAQNTRLALRQNVPMPAIVRSSTDNSADNIILASAYAPAPAAPQTPQQHLQQSHTATVLASSVTPHMTPKAQIAVKAAPIPVAPIPVAQVKQTTPTKVNDGIDLVQTASTKTPPGWIVQVGASDNQQGAMGLLERVKKKGGSVLDGTESFTMAYVKDGQQFYRARFGGFADQNRAVSACRSLKKKGISCWAAAQ